MKNQIIKVLKFPFKLTWELFSSVCSAIEETCNDVMSDIFYGDLKDLYDKFEANGLRRCQNGVYSNSEAYCTRYYKELDYYDVRSASLALASVENQVQHVVLEFDKAFKNPYLLHWRQLAQLKSRGELVFKVLEALNADYENFLTKGSSVESL